MKSISYYSEMNRVYHIGSLVAVFLLLVFTLQARDTIRVMQYNLLYYGVETGFCNSSNNNPQVKESYLRTLLAYTKPDIFTINEISKDETFQQRIIDSVFARITSKPYAKASTPNIAGSNIVNMIYYNERKFTLYRQEVAQSLLRDIDLYTLYYNSPDLADGDTVFIHCMVAHLKAGNTSSDAQQRATMTLNALNYLKSYKQPGNYLFMGDLNLYNSNEQAYQNLLFYHNVLFRFYDPVNQPGNWSDNPDFTNYHTQSTHTTGTCFSTGGLDDRFDFILISKDIQMGYDRVKYIPGSYKTIGQDGLRLNKSLLDAPVNNSAPYPVIEALYYISDHLPVMLSLEIDQRPASVPSQNLIHLSVNNPVTDYLIITDDKPSATDETYFIGLYSLTFSEILSYSGPMLGNQLSIPVSLLPRGMYLLMVRRNEQFKMFKIIKI